jgi:hypothetical protein
VRLVRRSGVGLALAVALSLAARVGTAQGRLSEKGSAAQTIAGTTITVEYYRPVARGRVRLFGDVVTWGEHWTPGANWATTLDTDHDVRVEGRLLPKGKYSLWTVVQPDSWVVELHRRSRLFHTTRPDSTDEQLKLTVRPDSGPPVEVLTFDFPEVAPAATTLRFRWGTTVLPLHIVALPPPLKLLPTRAERARFVGRYELQVLMETAAGGGGQRVVDIGESGDTLRWLDVARPEGELREFALSPLGADEFARSKRSATGEYWPDNGITVMFSVESGKVTGYEVLLEDGTVAARAKRVR